MLQLKVVIFPLVFVMLALYFFRPVFMLNFSVLCSIIPIKQVLEARPDICLLAEFPSEGRLVCSSVVIDL